MGIVHCAQEIVGGKDLIHLSPSLLGEELVLLLPERGDSPGLHLPGLRVLAIVVYEELPGDSEHLLLPLGGGEAELEPPGVPRVARGSDTVLVTLQEELQSEAVHDEGTGGSLHTVAAQTVRGTPTAR